MSAITPRNGPCSPWCAQSDIETLPWVAAAAAKAIASGPLTQGDVDAICAQSATAASEILYELSARVFTGSCGPVTVRPVSRPTDIDSRSLITSPSTWFSTWGLASGLGFQNTGIFPRYASTEPPTIRLPWPVTEITLVKIDGVVIPGPYDPVANPTGEWELRGNQELVRIRPTASYVPTQRWGWPTSQVQDIPDTQDGTFSITFDYGTPPPQSGVLAAIKLGEYLALPQLGDSTRYPRRTTAMTRQGVSAQVANVIDVLAKGSLGIWEVDAFVLAFNPRKLQRQAVVWSPDIGRPRRQANVTTS